MVGFERDMRNGMPTYILLGRYARFLGVDRTKLENARRTGFGAFECLHDDPELSDIPLALEPVALHDLIWERKTARIIGDDPYLIFALPEARFVGGVRFTFSHANQNGDQPEGFRVSWKRDDKENFTRSRTRQTRWHCLGPGDESITTWIGEVTRQIRIRPNSPKETYTMRLSEVALLVPTRGDRFSNPGGENGAPGSTPESKFEAREDLTYIGYFEERWPVDLRRSPRVFLEDVLSVGKP
jgi:hypothetical protein